jgi:hypothetical protein
VSVPNSTLKFGEWPAAPALEENTSLLHAVRGQKLKVEVPPVLRRSSGPKQ